MIGDDRENAPESTRQPLDALIIHAPGDERAPRRNGGPVPPPPPLPGPSWVEAHRPPPRRGATAPKEPSAPARRKERP